MGELVPRLVRIRVRVSGVSFEKRFVGHFLTFTVDGGSECIVSMRFYGVINFGNRRPFRAAQGVWEKSAVGWFGKDIHRVYLDVVDDR